MPDSECKIPQDHMAWNVTTFGSFLAELEENLEALCIKGSNTGFLNRAAELSHLIHRNYTHQRTRD